jgi:hypothetical protein
MWMSYKYSQEAKVGEKERGEAEREPNLSELISSLRARRELKGQTVLSQHDGELMCWNRRKC